MKIEVIANDIKILGESKDPDGKKYSILLELSKLQSLTILNEIKKPN